MSGGVDSSVTAALLSRAGLRRRRRHPAALRPWRRGREEGRLLRRPGHPRRPPGRRAARHPALRARLREPLPRRGDGGLRRRLPARRDAGALHRLQPHGQVPRPAADRARPRRRGAGHRPLCPPRDGRGGAGAAPRRRSRRATRAISCSPPRPSSSTSCASRWAACPRARRARWPSASTWRWPTSPTARTSASCPTATTPRVVQKLRPEAPSRARSSTSTAGVLGRHDGIVRYTVGQRRGLALGERNGTDNEPLYVVKLEPETRRVVVGPRSCARPQRDRALRPELARPRLRRRAAGAGEGALLAGPASGRRSSAASDALASASPSPRSAFRPARPA